MANGHSQEDAFGTPPEDGPAPVRYFFDFLDGDFRARDDEGTELPSLDAARQEALTTLLQMAKDDLRDGKRREFVVELREGSTVEPVLRVSLLLKVE